MSDATDPLSPPAYRRARDASPPSGEKSRLQRLDAMSQALDSQFRIPGLGLRVGWDAILGLIPGVGALVTLGPGVAMIAEGRRLGARKGVLARMAGNTLLDMGLGTVPVVGDIFDLFFKSHRRNIALLKAEAARLTARHQFADEIHDGV
ncbi:DUF4112 domain-containing protein [Tropicimonas sp. S265A]|uniref:DUF4112 domain-containing protein n=1 Tax=Tropicimonas sp. S265A TaxID=3415134 RepID=UPI003C799BE9